MFQRTTNNITFVKVIPVLSLQTPVLAFFCLCLSSDALVGQKWELVDTELDDSRSGKVLKGTVEGTMENSATNDGSCSVEIYIYEGAATNPVELKILKYGKSPEIMRLYNTYSIEYKGEDSSRKESFKLVWNTSNDKLFPAIKLGSKYVYQDNLLRSMLGNDKVECVIEHRFNLLPNAKYKFTLETENLEKSLAPIIATSLQREGTSKMLDIDDAVADANIKAILQEWQTLKEERQWNSKVGGFSVIASFERFLPDQKLRLRETASKRIIDVNTSVFSDNDQKVISRIREVLPVIEKHQEIEKAANAQKKILSDFTSGWQQYIDICVQHDDAYLKIASDPDLQDFEKREKHAELAERWLDNKPIDIKVMFLLDNTTSGVPEWRGYFYNNTFGYPARINLAVGRNAKSGINQTNQIPYGTLMVYSSRIGFGNPGSNKGVTDFNPSTPTLRSGDPGLFYEFNSVAKKRGLSSMASSVSYAIAKVRPATEDEKKIVPQLKLWLNKLHEEKIAPRAVRN